MNVGGTNHHISIYEDWDFKIRLAAQSGCWAYSGVKGTAYRRTGSGLSSINALQHINNQCQVLWSNRDLLEKYIGRLGFWKSITLVTPTQFTSHPLTTPKQDLRYYFLWLWALVITASLVVSPRLGESGLLKFIRIDDILFPITVVITVFLLRCIHPLIKLIYAFLSLYLFNIIVLFITHYSGFNTVGIIEKLLPTCKNIQYLIYFCLFFSIALKVKNIKQIKYLFLEVEIMGYFLSLDNL